MTLTLRLKLQADFTPLLAGRQVLYSGVSPTGEAILLVASQSSVEAAQAEVEAALGEDARDARLSFPFIWTTRPLAVEVLLHNGRHIVQQVQVSELPVAYPMAQSLLNGELLIVGKRCHRSPNGTSEHNARVYAPDGQALRSFVLGDGIADVQTTATGDVWVSYFDEGIFGNTGWNQRVTGLGWFDDAGTKRWDYQPPPGFDHMADCYALNVADGSVWAYYYTDFPLVRIGPDGAVRAWHTDIDGAHAFAVDSRRVLLFGGYGSDRGRAVLAAFGEERLEHPLEARLVIPSGDPVRADHVVGRGPILHVFADTHWYQFDLRQLRSTASP